MTGRDWIVVEKVAGELQAELLRGLLEAQGIPTRLVQEGVGRAVGLTVGPMGEVEIMVPNQNSSQARLVIAQYYAGEFEGEEFEGEV
jgi:hypothetical protein